MDHLCPVCAVPLKPEQVHGVTIETCPTCAGFWFDQGELGNLTHEDPRDLEGLDDQAAPQVARLTQTPHERKCPCCGEPLYRYRYLYSSPVELDGCEKCNGVWVDHGELQKMHASLAAERTGQVGAGKLSPEQALELANFNIQHDNVMARQRWLRSLFTVLDARWPFFGYGWI